MFASRYLATSFSSSTLFSTLASTRQGAILVYKFLVPRLPGKHTKLCILIELFTMLYHVVFFFKFRSCYYWISLLCHIFTLSRPADRTSIHNPPWFCKEWRVPLNRGIYTAFSYILFITLVIYRMTEPQEPIVYLVDAMLGVFITSYRYVSKCLGYFALGNNDKFILAWGMLAQPFFSGAWRVQVQKCGGSRRDISHSGITTTSSWTCSS